MREIGKCLRTFKTKAHEQQDMTQLFIINAKGYSKQLSNFDVDTFRFIKLVSQMISIPKRISVRNYNTHTVHFKFILQDYFIFANCKRVGPQYCCRNILCYWLLKFGRISLSSGFCYIIISNTSISSNDRSINM